MRISDWRSDVALPIECDAPGLPVRLCLLDPLPARRDEVPPDEALAERLAAEQHDGRGLFSGDRRRRIAPEDEHLARRVDVPLRCDAPLGNVGRAFRMALRQRSEEHTSELQSLMRISYAVFCLKQKNNKKHQKTKY